MLVLSRKVGESIVIGDDIEITISQVAGKRIKLSIDAPRSVRVARSEIIVDDQRPSATPEQKAVATRKDPSCRLMAK